MGWLWCVRQSCPASCPSESLLWAASPAPTAGKRPCACGCAGASARGLGRCFFGGFRVHRRSASRLDSGGQRLLRPELDRDIEEKNMIYAGAGHMPLLLWRPAEKKIYEFREKGTILGQFEDIQFKNIRFPLKPDDRIILYTDGIVETSNPANALFGFDRLKEFIMSHARLPAGQFADALVRRIFNWSGKPSEEALDDDLTLIVADYKHA